MAETVAVYTVTEVKHALRIDNAFNDTQISQLISSAKSALEITIDLDTTYPYTGYNDFVNLLNTYLVEYVRGYYFTIDNQKTIEVLQTQLERLYQQLIEGEESE